MVVGADSEIFLLYNMREERAVQVAAELRERGVPLYYFDSDLKVGDDIQETEAAKLRSARGVVALLGRHGWGVSQEELGEEAVALGKPILPVLIGDPPEPAMGQVGALFRRRRRLDLREPRPELYDQLTNAIAEIETAAADDATSAGGAAPRFDEIINTLADGSDADRSLQLQRLIQYPVPNAAALARRLRSEITENYAPGQEERFATAVRAPKKLASARSWMLSVLIWLEPNNPESRTVILGHLHLDREPDREVRFWTLAGIVQRKLDYLPDALRMASEDPAREISGLVSIVRTPESESVLQQFRKSLDAAEFEVAWYVLRILRIVAIPALAEDVVRQLDRRAEDKPLAYDALFALASPEMARAAREHILKRFGLDRLVGLIVQEARSATTISRVAFAHILTVFDQAPVAAALRQAALNPENRTVIQEIAYEIARVLEQEDLSAPPIAGFSSDKINILQDDIGIKKDVETLASVILAREVTPPLAIGLFGEWGSGKSFFMDSIEEACRRISKHAKEHRPEQFCTDIVQIDFNAWHYADANLWASLVSHILDKLSQHLAPVQTAEQQQATLASELASAQSEMQAAQAEKERAAKHLEKTARELQDKIVERERQEVRLRDLRAADLGALLQGDTALKASIDKALTSVGAPAALESIEELNKVVADSYSTAGRATAFVVSLFSGSNVALTFLGIAAFFIVPPLLVWGIETYWTDQFAADVSALIAKVTVVAGSVTVVLKSAIGKAKSGLDALSAAKRAVDKQLAEKRQTPTEEEKQLEKKLHDAKASEQAAIDRVSAASARAQDLESRVALLKESQSLGYFVAERSRSDDYRRHLGLISTVRKDFDGLVDRLKAKGAPQGKPIDRIVLYIDDVDRCPPKMVVDILQAIHLLLAYELFVVVVSVDPRWLLRSLESRFTTLQHDGDADTWDATPQDYLEKIFQIPFSVRPMGDRGFGRLIDRLLVSSPTIAASSEGAGETKTGAEGFADSKGNGDLAEGGEKAALREQSATGDAGAAQRSAETESKQSAETESKPDAKPTPPPPPPVEALAEALTVKPTETAFARTLYRLLPTPRGAKRFANIYRVMKASLSRNDLAPFEGSEGVRGEFQLPMLLLALLVGHARVARSLFPEFLANARQGKRDWWSPAQDTDVAPDEHKALRAELAEILGAPLFPSSTDLLIEWLPRVARYSFTTAKMFLNDSDRSALRHEVRAPDMDGAGD